MATTAYGFTVPSADDQVDGPAQMQALADSIGPYTMMRYDSAAARDAFVTNPLEGMVSWLRDVSQPFYYDGAAWTQFATAAAGYDTDPGAIAAGFTLTDVFVRTLLGGKLVTLALRVQTTSLLTTTNGNIPDTLCYTLDAEYRPAETVALHWNSQVSGGALLTSAGTVTLTTASDNVATGLNINLFGVWIMP